MCLSEGAVVWLALSYVYKALLQLVAMFMAFYTRQVKIKALNDSKEIAVVIYFNSITLTLLAVVEFALKQYHEVYAALFMQSGSASGGVCLSDTHFHSKSKMIYTN